ncbi:exosortase A [Muricoccus radiodurans]|uniref:exosortase A n=1 Tax=Muricoccus radiodurans TaxID=2231721 RepID=UPI003CEC1C66
MPDQTVLTPAPVWRSPASSGAALHRQAWGRAAAALALGVVALGILFHAEVSAALRIWMSSTAYSHGPLVLPIAIWLAWVRRARLSVILPAPSPWLALAVLPTGLAWLAAERMGIMEGRQFAALGAFYALVLAVLGWRACRAMAAPLAYLVFLVPFGAFAVPALQSVTARMIGFGLSLTSIPHYVDDLVIEIPAGTFYVAEACAGLRFLIAALAFGALYALVMFRSPWRRLAVMALAVAVPVLANGVRTFGLVVLAHLQGSAASIEADHVLYGWVFFTFVLLLLILAGLPFRQDGAIPVPAAPPPGRAAPWAGRLALALLCAVGLASAGPLLAATLDRAVAPAIAHPARLAAPSGCTAAPDGTLRCQDMVVSARLLVFPARVNWSAVATERRRVTGAADDEVVTFDVRTSGVTWGARQAPGGNQVLAAAAWLDGRPAADGIRTRATQAWRGLVGGAGRPVLAVVELRSDRPGQSGGERALLRTVLEAQGGGVAAQAASRSSGPGQADPDAAAPAAP